jgi:hypothetical protein
MKIAQSERRKKKVVTNMPKKEKALHKVPQKRQKLTILMKMVNIRRVLIGVYKNL